MRSRNRCPVRLRLGSVLRRREAGTMRGGGGTIASSALSASREQPRDMAHLNRLAVLGELTASVLHQVNGPLTFVLLNLQRLERDASNDQGMLEAVRAAFEGAEMIRAMSRDVTLFARGGTRVFGEVDLATTTRAARRIVEARVRSVAAFVEEVGAAPRVRGDATRLLQVVVNVLLNAADACEASGVAERTIRMTLGTDAHGDAMIAIADDALGLAPESAARVFDAFFTTKAPGSGTGLGLSLAKEIVEEAGGRITFESALGVGTTVRVVLPALRVEPRSPSWR